MIMLGGAKIVAAKYILLSILQYQSSLGAQSVFTDNVYCLTVSNSNSYSQVLASGGD